MVLVEEVLGGAAVVLAEGNETKGAEVISAAKAVFARKLHSRGYMAPPTNTASGARSANEVENKFS